MFKGLKIKFNVAKNECCSIKIQEMNESNEDNNTCCDVNIEPKENCCE